MGRCWHNLPKTKTRITIPNTGALILCIWVRFGHLELLMARGCASGYSLLSGRARGICCRRWAKRFAADQHGARLYQDGLVGHKWNFIYADFGPDMELQGENSPSWYPLFADRDSVRAARRMRGCSASGILMLYCKKCVPQLWPLRELNSRELSHL